MKVVASATICPVGFMMANFIMGRGFILTEFELGAILGLIVARLIDAAQAH